MNLDPADVVNSSRVTTESASYRQKFVVGLLYKCMKAEKRNQLTPSICSSDVLKPLNVLRRTSMFFSLNFIEKLHLWNVMPASVFCHFMLYSDSGWFVVAGGCSSHVVRIGFKSQNFAPVYLWSPKLQNGCWWTSRFHHSFSPDCHPSSQTTQNRLWR